MSGSFSIAQWILLGWICYWVIDIKRLQYRDQVRGFAILFGTDEKAETRSTIQLRIIGCLVSTIVMVFVCRSLRRLSF